MLKQHGQMIEVLTAILDLAVTLGAWIACYYLRFFSGWFSVQGDFRSLAEMADTIVFSLVLMMLVFGRMNIYTSRRLQDIRREVFDILRACLTVWAVLSVISFFLHTWIPSRKLLGLFLVVWPAMLISYRLAVRLVLRFARRRGRNTRSVAIIGSGRLGQSLLHALRRQSWSGYVIQYWVEDRRIGEQFLGIPVRGPLEQVDKVIARWPVDAVFIALPQERSSQIAQVLEKLSTEIVDVNVVPDMLSYQFLRHEVRQLGPLAVVNLTRSPHIGWNAMLKRVMDVTLSLGFLAVLAPLMLLIAAAIKLTSPGSVFYRQRRAGLGGREFDMIKFRSMIPQAEAANGATWGAEVNDPRVTPIGRLLRRTSLDELPQLLNVLRGDMSLVGPRPERPEFIRRFSSTMPRYMLRHHVKAGMTGWAQVNGFRGRTSLQKRIQYDLDYINRWSMWFDLWILMLTVFRGFLNRQS